MTEEEKLNKLRRSLRTPYDDKMDMLRNDLHASLKELRALLGTVHRHSPEAEQIAQEIWRKQRMLGAIGGAA
jgi:small-conductance mechanosensitive channel